MLNEESVANLQQTAVFSGMEYADLRTIARYAQEKRVERNGVILQEGRVGDALYVILEGRVKVMLLRSRAPESQQRFSDVDLNTLGRLDCFGEYSLIDRKPASASVIALEPTVLFELTRVNFENLVAESDRIARIVYYNLLRMLIDRLRHKDQELDLSFDI